MLRLEDLRMHKTYYCIYWPYRYKKELIPWWSLPGVKSFQLVSDRHCDKSRKRYLNNLKKMNGNTISSSIIQGATQRSLNNSIVLISSNNYSEIESRTVFKECQEETMTVGSSSICKRNSKTYLFDSKKEAYKFIFDRLDLLESKIISSIEWINNQLLSPSMISNMDEFRKQRIDHKEGEILLKDDNIWYSFYTINYDIDNWLNPKTNLIFPVSIEPKSTILQENVETCIYSPMLYSNDFIKGRVPKKSMIVSKDESYVRKMYYSVKNSKLLESKNECLSWLNKFSSLKAKMEKRLLKLM